MKYEDTVVIVADMGELKAFEMKRYEGLVENEMKVSYSLEALDDINYGDAHKRVQDIISDSAGRFGNSMDRAEKLGDSRSSIGENHNLETERKKRSIEDIASDINTIIENKKPKQLFLAFPQELNAQLLDELTQETRNILVKNVGSNLINTNTDEILSYF